MILFLFSCNGPAEKGPEIDLEPVTDTQTETEAPSTSQPDSLTELYLLELRAGGANYIWRFHTDTFDIEEAGELHCPLSNEDDYLTALTSDPKGILWGLSEEYVIVQINPSSLACTLFGARASNEYFLAESFAFIEQEGQPLFYMAGYHTGSAGASSTALAKLADGAIQIIAEIGNLEGQDTVIDVATSPDQALFGYRGWGNLSEQIRFSPDTGVPAQTWTVSLETGEAFAFLRDNQTSWIFTATAEGGSQIHTFAGNELIWARDLQITVVGAAGIN